uniref:PiggyBac transposable element-derived protein domain-containing protein n=1 Tax=Glossina palpalis gambiensis TaxID=67801 RepID=A0A1B0B541_9MUSC
MVEMDFTGIDDSSDESTIVFHKKRPRLMVLSSSTEENEIYDWEEENDEETEWKQVTGRSSSMYQYMGEEKLLDGNLFLSDNLLELIVKETNRYAEQSNVGVESKSLLATRKHQQSWMALTLLWVKYCCQKLSYIVIGRKVKLYGRKIQCIHTCNGKICTGKTVNSTTKGHAHNVVMRFMNGSLFEGRTLYTNSYYTCVSLAGELLDKSTNLCGTVKVNRKFLLVVAKLKQKRGTSGKLKPDAIFDYYNAKKGVDISDQIAPYYNSLPKSIKWYRKIIIELICAASIANAWYILLKWSTKHFDVLQFRENSLDRLLDEMPKPKT